MIAYKLTKRASYSQGFSKMGTFFERYYRNVDCAKADAVIDIGVNIGKANNIKWHEVKNKEGVKSYSYDTDFYFYIIEPIFINDKIKTDDGNF